MNNNNETQHTKLGGIFLIIGWVVAIGLISLLVDQAMYSSKAPEVAALNGITEIKLTREADSHFRIPGSINGVETVFLIDTGATTIAVTEDIAKAANLPKLSEVSTQTAGGSSIGYFTRIESLQISGIEFNNLSAIIIPQMGYGKALLGMNVLKNFNIKQNVNEMVLSIPQPS